MTDLIDLPSCVSRCDVCGHEPVDTWKFGFGCNVCKGADAVMAECERAWAAGEDGPCNSPGGAS